MKPIATDQARLEAAGFVDVEILDRTAWFVEYSEELVQHLRGPQYAAYAEALGEKDAKDGLVFAQERVTLSSQGQLRPGHLRGRKSR